MLKEKPARRTQEQRTAETRTALFKAAVKVIDRVGYSAANNASIADEAGVSRGAITHHFSTRAAFMAEIVQWVFEQETAFFNNIAASGEGARASEWPALLWQVFSQPSGVAVLEILVATRSDPELAALTKPAQSAIERLGAANFLHRGDATAPDMAVIRMVVWAIRGMTMGRGFIEGPGVMDDAVALLCRLIDHAAPEGTFAELRRV
jgi:AcrR family transcriptional regulator